MLMSREWAFPSSETFSIKPIKGLLERYCVGVIVDPFARNNKIATLTNDINPETTASHHLDAVDFLDMMLLYDVKCDVALLDPPYSSRQVSECYEYIGRRVTQRDTQYSPAYNDVKDRIHKMLKPNGVIISFGWNSIGMGINRGYKQIEIMLVSHGGCHNDTIVTVEKKLDMNMGTSV